MDKEVVKIEDLTKDSASSDKPKSKLNLFKFFNGKNIKIAFLVMLAIISLIIFMKFSLTVLESLVSVNVSILVPLSYIDNLVISPIIVFSFDNYKLFFVF